MNRSSARNGSRCAVLLTALTLLCAPGLSGQELSIEARVTHLGFGPVLLSLHEEELAQLFGPGVIEEAEFYIAEGFCSPGARVFAGTPFEVGILWSTDQPRRIAGLEASVEGSVWRTARGIGVGSTVQELVEAAGAHFTFTGFDWDYGGWAGWNEGDLQLSLRLQPDMEVGSDPRYGELTGDQQVSTSHPLVMRSDIRVESLYLPGMAEPGEQAECSAG